MAIFTNDPITFQSKEMFQWIFFASERVLQIGLCFKIICDDGNFDKGDNEFH